MPPFTVEVTKGMVKHVNHLLPRLRYLVREISNTDEIHVGKQLFKHTSKMCSRFSLSIII